MAGSLGSVWVALWAVPWADATAAQWDTERVAPWAFVMGTLMVVHWGGTRDETLVAARAVAKVATSAACWVAQWACQTDVALVATSVDGKAGGKAARWVFARAESWADRWGAELAGLWAARLGAVSAGEKVVSGTA